MADLLEFLKARPGATAPTGSTSPSAGAGEQSAEPTSAR
jgi:hypothetical protein